MSERKITKPPKFSLIPPLVVLLLSGCTPTPPQAQTKICLDGTTKQRVDDHRCDTAAASNYYGGASHSNFGAYYWFYMMGRSSYVPPIGSVVPSSYGSFAPQAGTAYRSGSTPSGGGSSEGVSRGGFGASSHSAGGAA